MKSTFTALLLTICTLSASLAEDTADKEVFRDNFETAAKPGWSKTTESKTPVGARGFLGEFGSESVGLDLRDLPPHHWATVTFDVFALRAMDGNSVAEGPDIFTLRTGDGRILARTTFGLYSKKSWQSFPGLAGMHRYPRSTGAAETNSLGIKAGNRDMNAVYHFTCRFPHSGPELALFFEGLFDSPIDDEAWGLDNVVVSVSDGEPVNDPAALESAWAALADDDGVRAWDAVRQLTAMGDHAVPFLVSKIRDTVRPDAADILLSPATAFLRLQPAPTGDELILPAKEDRQRALAAFVLQSIGTAEARAAVAAWKPAAKRPEIHFTLVTEDGRPAPFVPVRISESCGSSRTGRTAADGTFTLVLPEKDLRYCTLSTDSPEWVKSTWSWSADKTASPAAPPSDVNLPLEKPVRIGGTVVDDEGTPVEGATVVVCGSKKSPSGDLRTGISYESVKTGPHGEWHYDRMVAKPDSVRLGVLHPWYVSSGDGFYELRECDNTADLFAGKAVLKLNRGLRIDGVVKDAEGHPVKGATIGFGRDRVASNALPENPVDEEGRFRLAAMPGTTAILTAKAPGFAPAQVRLPMKTSPQEVTITMEPARALTGLVVDSEGKPLPGVRIFMDTWHDTRTLTLGVDTGADGRFEWKDAPADELKVDVMKRGYADARGVTVQAGRENRITLLPPTIVQGSVVDAETGKPVPAFVITKGIQQPDNPQISWLDRGSDRGLPGKDGTFRLELSYPYPACILRVSADGYAPEDSSPFSLEGKTLDLVFRLHKAEATTMRLLDPEGRPLAGAEVYIASADRHLFIENGKMDPHSSREAAQLLTGADGSLRIPAQKDPFALVVLNDKGCAILTQDLIAPGKDITLQPWASVSGELRIGTKPGAGEKVGLFPRSPDQSRLQNFFYSRYSATTDREGRFSFDRVIPGPIALGRWITKDSTGGSCVGTLRTEAPAGKPTKVTLGGSGRPVTGKILLPPDVAKTDWLVPDSSIRTTHPTYPPLPAEVATIPPDKRAEWFATWYKTPEGKTYSKAVNDLQDANRNYVLPVLPDGTFRADDVEPGDYTLSVTFCERPAGNRCGWGDEIARASTTFTMPPVEGGVSDDPLVLPPVEATPVKNLKVGDPIPGFIFKTLDGREINTADLRGKFLLLDFWATWCAPCVAESPNLKALYEKFGKNPAFLMIGLSKDAAPDAPRDYAKKENLAWTQGFIGPDETISSQFGIRGIPSIWLISPEGKVLAKDLRGEALHSAVAQALEAKP